MAKFHVLVEWPDPKEQPWLILIEASTGANARIVVEESEEIRDGGGRVVQVEEAP